MDSLTRQVTGSFVLETSLQKKLKKLKKLKLDLKIYESGSAFPANIQQ
jgi:hypothetical protein